MINYTTMLERLNWDLKKDNNDLKKLEMILASLKNSLSTPEHELDAHKEYINFGEYVTERNIYASAILFKRALKMYGSNDLCTSSAQSVLDKDLSELRLDGNDVHLRLLAIVELKRTYHIPDYVRTLIKSGKLKSAVGLLACSDDFPGTVLSFLNLTIKSFDGSYRRSVMSTLLSFKWNFEISQLKNKQTITELTDFFIECTDVWAMLNLFDLFIDLKYSEIYPEKSLDDWKEFLLPCMQPISLMFYRKLLKREGFSGKELIEKLQDFTYWNTNNNIHIINNYLYFGYAVSECPEEYDYYAELFSPYIEETEKRFSDEDDVPGYKEYSRRYYNYLVVEKPLLALISKNPDKIPDFLSMVKAVNLYDISQSLSYRKSDTWLEVSGYSLNEYKRYLDYIEKKYSSEDVFKIYMSTPLKSMIDITYVLRLLFMPQNSYKDLTEKLASYTFRGKLTKVSAESKKTSFRVTISNASSTYVFPIHHSWTTAHMDELENNFKDGDVVYFKIMSINNHGMIFTYELSPRIQVSKSDTANKEVRSEVVKALEKIKDDTLPLQGKNSFEKIRLFSMAIICDDEDRILVEKKKKANSVIEHLPCLPISNNETSQDTIKRLLKYYLDFTLDVPLSLCGIRHLRPDKTTRSIFFIYKIPFSSLAELQDPITLKSSISWENIEEYKENISDSVSESFINVLDSTFSEETLRI